MDKLTSIRAFTRVVQHGSFAAAARELRLSRSAVSKYVIDLEQELGVAAAGPHHPQRQPDRERAGLLRALHRHPGRSRGGRPRGGAAAIGAARPVARQCADVVRHAPSRPRGRGLHGAISAAADPAGAERSADRSGAGRLRRHAAHRRPAVIEPDRPQDRARATRGLRGAVLSGAARRAASIPTTCAITTASPTATSPPATSGSSPARTATTGFAFPGRSAPTTARCCATPW